MRILSYACEPMRGPNWARVGISLWNWLAKVMPSPFLPAGVVIYCDQAAIDPCNHERSKGTRLDEKQHAGAPPSMARQ